MKKVGEMMWCECCRDHFPDDHFVLDWISPIDGQIYENGDHGVGKEYGPYGELLWKAQEYDRITERFGTIL